jgi:hypothetical protein
MILDSDEIWDPKQINIVKHDMNIFPNINIFTSGMITYFKSIRYRIHPPQHFEPVIAVRTNIRFEHARRPRKGKFHKTDAIYHHPSHVRSDEYMKKKIDSCSEKEKIRNWYEDIWKKWTPDMKNFHPTVPESFHSVVQVKRSELPVSLQKIWDNSSNNFLL